MGLLNKYGGEITSESINEYLDRLVGKIYKLLCLYEENYESFLSNHKTLMQELCAGEAMILYCGFYVELINKLESLTTITEHTEIKKHVRECIDITKTLKKKVGEWEIGKSIG
jgi:hypothetical protein